MNAYELADELEKVLDVAGLKDNRVPAMLRQQADRIAELEKKLQESAMNFSCAECGADGGHALYCVLCAEKFVGGYKESVPVHASELLTQVSTDTQYAGNGTAGIQNETKPTGFFFQIPPQTKPLSDEEIKELIANKVTDSELCRAIEERHGIK